jgi:hypothetical protein
MSDPNLIGHIHGVGIGQFIKDYWTLAVAVIGFIVSILVLVKGKIPLLEKRVDDAFNKLEKLEGGDFVAKQTCLLTRGDCQMHQGTYHDNFCKKLDLISFELKGIVADADDKRETTRHEITTMNIKLIETMTQMKTILARDRKEETADMVKMVVQQVMLQMKNGNSKI